MRDEDEALGGTLERTLSESRESGARASDGEMLEKMTRASWQDAKGLTKGGGEERPAQEAGDRVEERRAWARRSVVRW